MSDWMPEEDFLRLLARLFPQGLGGKDVLEALCPQGWRASPLRLAFHPTPERQWEETLACRRNLEWLGRLPRRTQPAPPLEPLPDRETFLAKARAQDDDSKESDASELGRLVGLCLWDVTSDNNDLILPDGHAQHPGSFRFTAGLIADFFYRPCGSTSPDAGDGIDFNSDYIEFYMGTWGVEGRTDLTPVYRLIFSRLQKAGFSWRYNFTTIGMVRFDQPEEDTPQGWQDYSPSESLAQQEKKKKEDAEHDRLADTLEEINREALEETKYRPPPPSVLAFQQVFGRWPAGWPPWEQPPA